MPRTAQDSSGRGKDWITPLLVFGVALALRVLFVVHLQESPLADVPLRDELTLVEWARAIASGDLVGSGVFFRAPLYPYLLGLEFALFDGSLLAARVSQAVLGSLIPVVVYFLGRRVFGKVEGAIAGAVTAAYPFLVYFSNELLIVTPAILLDVLLLLMVLRADDRSSPGRWLAAGLVFGFSAIARPNVLAFAPALLLWLWFRARGEISGASASRGAAGGRSDAGAVSRGTVGGRSDAGAVSRGAAGARSDSAAAPTRDAPSRAVRAPISRPIARAANRFALVTLGLVLVIASVAARNYFVADDFVPIASQGGINFFIGNNSSSDGASAMLPELGTDWEYEDAIRAAERAEGRSLGPSEVSAYWYRRGRRFLADRPGEAARLYLKKLVLFWDRHEIGSNKDIYYFGGMSPVFRTFSWLNFLVVAPLGLLGMIVSFRRRPGAFLLSLFVLSYMLSVLLFFVNGRFRLPVVPALILLAVSGGAWLIERLRSRDLRRFATGAVFVVAVGLFVNADFYGTHVTEHAHTHYSIGLTLAWKGEYEEAIEQYRAAIELWPGYASAYDAMGRSLESVGRLEEALDAYSEAARRNPRLAEAPMHAGVVLLRMGSMDEGIDRLREAVRRDPLLAEAHFYLGSTLAGEGRLEEAEESFRKAVSAEPRLAEAWNGLGRVLEDTGRSGEALRAYETALSADPGLIDAHNNMAVLLARLGRYDRSIGMFEAALEIAPDDERLRANLKTVRELKRGKRTEEQ
ncbi:MAG: tetratricopeptide repeat protein [Candidatus Eisenbacteria bacterium]|nr:tetratricopeptide repeat protein [Candidatus Eisenbacteria bacterium]